MHDTIIWAMTALPRLYFEGHHCYYFYSGLFWTTECLIYQALNVIIIFFPKKKECDKRVSYNTLVQIWCIVY